MIWARTFAHADRRLLSILDQNPARAGHHLELGVYGSEELYSSIEYERGLRSSVGQWIASLNGARIRHDILIIPFDASFRSQDSPAQLPLNY